MSGWAWQLTGANGTHLFATEAAAKEALRKVPLEWGTFNTGSPQIRRVKLFHSAEAWSEYTGMGR